MKGVSENIMVNQLSPMGTGCFDVIIKQEKFKNPKVQFDQYQQIQMVDMEVEDYTTSK